MRTRTRRNRGARRLLQPARFVFPSPRPVPRVTAHPTPNPDSLKFTSDGAAFIDAGLQAYGSAREAEGNALGAALFALRGVANVFVVPQFVTVTKHPAADWDLLVPAIASVLGDHLDGR